MIYDFSFFNTSRDEKFFLYILARTAKSLHLDAFFYTHAEHTHCLLPDISALSESYKTYISTDGNPLESYRNNDINYAQNILQFANDMAHNMPLSLYFYFLQLTPINPPKDFYEALNIPSSPISLSDICTHALPLGSPQITSDTILHNTESILAHFDTPKTYYYTPLAFQHILNPSSGTFGLLNPPNTPAHKPFTEPNKDYFTQSVQSLKSGESITFSTSRGTQLLSLVPTSSTHTTIACDIASLKTYFRAHQTHIDILASFEKPLTHLVPKEVFQSQFPINKCGLVQVGLPYDMPLALLGALLLQEEISYFFLSHTTESAPFDFQHSPSPKEQILSIAQNGIFIDTHITQGNTLQSLIDAHLNPKDNQRHLVIYLSTRNPSAFLIVEQTARILLDIAFENNPRLILENIARSYESGDELLKNFSRLFPNLTSNAFTLPSTSIPSSNLIDIFDSAATILGFHAQDSNDKNAIFYRAYRLVRERGPRIDYKLLRKDNEISLDYHRIIRSCLSFKCAGMEDEILCFGLLDSLSEFVATLVRDTLTNLTIDKVLLLGDMLSHHIFLDRILEYLPKNIQLLLPKDGLIDY